MFLFLFFCCCFTFSIQVLVVRPFQAPVVIYREGPLFIEPYYFSAKSFNVQVYMLWLTQNILLMSRLYWIVLKNSHTLLQNIVKYGMTFCTRQSKWKSKRMMQCCVDSFFVANREWNYLLVLHRLHNLSLQTHEASRHCTFSFFPHYL